MKDPAHGARAARPRGISLILRALHSFSRIGTFGGNSFTFEDSLT
jgi:hypothetical protein